MLNKKFIVVLVLISLVTGVFWCIKYSHDPGISDDARGYDELAVSITENGLTEAFRGMSTDKPVYPMFLAGVYSVFGHRT